MTCPSKEELAALYDGVLPKKRADKIRRHLCRCMRCSREIMVLDTLMSLGPAKRKLPDSTLRKALELHGKVGSAKPLERYKEKGKKQASIRR